MRFNGHDMTGITIAIYKISTGNPYNYILPKVSARARRFIKRFNTKEKAEAFLKSAGIDYSRYDRLR